MASLLQVKQYLAHWIQLGKKIQIRNGDFALLPSRVCDDTNDSAEFERLWKLILSSQSGDCYLEGTTQTIDELLTAKWDLVDCARCGMLIPLLAMGMPPENCPCVDLPHWPNTEVPSPISRVAVRSKLADLQHRLGLQV
jgi:hypothetical protein